MSNKIKVVLLGTVTVIILVVSLGVFFYQKQQSLSQNSLQQNQSANQAADQGELPRVYEKPIICSKSDIANLAKLDSNKQYIFMPDGEAQSDISSYNNYLFCKLFLKNSSADMLDDLIGNSNDFSQKAYMQQWFAKLNSLNVIFKNVDCGSSDVNIAVNKYKKAILEPLSESAPINLSDNLTSNIKTNLSNISSLDLCGFFKRTPETVAKLKKDDFCAGSFECNALMNDDIEICTKLSNEGDVEMCKDNIWYQRALGGDDIGMCSNIKSFNMNIACQVYFIDNDSMCDGMANDISNKFFCK